jgi:hypothetical protein
MQRTVATTQGKPRRQMTMGSSAIGDRRSAGRGCVHDPAMDAPFVDFLAAYSEWMHPGEENLWNLAKRCVVLRWRSPEKKIREMNPN